MKFRSVLVVFAWLFLTVLTASRVDTYNHAFAEAHSAGDVPVLFRFFGEGRSIVSSLAILQADRYFHGGVGHIEHGEEGELCITQRGTDECGREEDRRLQASPLNVLFRISDRIALTEHVHLQGDQVKEIIPWLYLSSEVDPHNVLAITLTGFYLADRLDKPDEAVAFLRKGLLDNPDSWEINAELGRIYFEDFGNYRAAVDFLVRAMDLQKGVPHDKFEERYVLSFLAYSYEALGEGDKALALYRRLGQLFPKSDVFRKKVSELSAAGSAQ